MAEVKTGKTLTLNLYGHISDVKSTKVLDLNFHRNMGDVKSAKLLDLHLYRQIGDAITITPASLTSRNILWYPFKLGPILFWCQVSIESVMSCSEP